MRLVLLAVIKKCGKEEGEKMKRSDLRWRKINKVIIPLLIIGMIITFCGCSNAEDKAEANKVIAQIDLLDIASVREPNKIYEVQEAFNSLTESQKKLVTNQDYLYELLDKISQFDEETFSITMDDIRGLWEEDNPESVHCGYIFFSSDDSVYYMGSKKRISIKDMSADYIIGSNYSIGEYNYETNQKDGKIENGQVVYRFSLEKNDKKDIVLEIENDVIKGTYHKIESIGKTTNDVNITPNCIVEGCDNIATHKLNGTSGIEWYCNSHYEEMQDFANELIDAADSSNKHMCAICQKSAEYEDPYDNGTWYCYSHYQDAIKWYTNQ